MVGADERSGKERRGMNWEIEMEKMVKTGMHFLEKHVGCIGRIALAVYVMRDRDQEAILEFLGGGSGGAAAGRIKGVGLGVPPAASGVGFQRGNSQHIREAASKVSSEVTWV
ncbi:hypothetical protein GOBAR_DD05254 [Gossypium barbadense]|nr:hypothetical protein GOBAR_DD05254 [Gossypium barbadense]